MLNPLWLKTFIVLVDTGHFTKTAEKLYMTQPGVSQHINKLEGLCGHSLITRNKKSFTVTEQGKLVYSYTKALFKNESRLIEQLNFDDPYTGECSLACSGSVALLLYPRLLTLQKQHPNLHINIKAAPNHQIIRDIKNELIDQGIVTDVPNEMFFDFKKIGQEELCLVVPSTTVPPSNLTDLLTDTGIISHPDAEHYLSLYFKQSDNQNLKRLDIGSVPVVGSINQISQILEPVAQGIGFTVLPRSTIDNFHSPELLNVIPSQQPVVENLYLVCKKNRELPARYKALTAIIRDAWI